VRGTFEPTPEESGYGDESQVAAAQTKPTRNRGPPRARHGTMDREFKFPPAAGSPDSSDTVSGGRGGRSHAPDDTEEAGFTTADIVAPSNSSEEVPPPPIEKERLSTSHEDGDEDVGETEEISLN